MTLPHVTFEEVKAAAARIRPFVHRTPVETSATLDAELEAEVFFKCENLQKVGAFKARGATNAVMTLDDDQAASGVVTHSSGNHGAALAYAASRRGVRCVVVMPDHAPGVKMEAVRGYGAEIVVVPHVEREAATRRLSEEQGLAIIHPYDNERVIAGQGTAALELIEEVTGLDAVITPVGGGGLLSGTAVAVLGLDPEISILGAEPGAVDDAARSLATGVRQPPVADPVTVADGLLTDLGVRNFDILTAAGARIVTVGEDEILAAARFHLERMKLVVEPSGATALAALRRLGGEIVGKRVGAILSGGNTDFAWLKLR